MKGKRERLNGLRVLTCGAAMFDPAVLQDLMERGFFIAQMYGLTETCRDGAWNSSQEEKYLTSVGPVSYTHLILQIVLTHCVQKRPGRSHVFSGALNLTRIKQKA